MGLSHKGQNSWKIVVGNRESGEPIKETAKRELFEETGREKVDLLTIRDFSLDDTGRVLLFYIVITIQQSGAFPKQEMRLCLRIGQDYDVTIIMRSRLLLCNNQVLARNVLRDFKWIFMLKNSLIKSRKFKYFYSVYCAYLFFLVISFHS